MAPPHRASRTTLSADAAALRRYVEAGTALIAPLRKAARHTQAWEAARTVGDALRSARLEFARAHAAYLYAILTDDYRRFLRVDELCYLAAERYPGLVPTAAQVGAERELPQKDKLEGLEEDQGILLWKIFDDPLAGSHLIHAMQRPKRESLERLDDFRATGEADLGVVHVSRKGKAGFVEIRNLRYLNAEDNAATAALETGVDLVLLHPEIEVGVLRGGIVEHPKHAGRRIFQAGANLTALYHGKMGLIEFFLDRELGYINKIYRGLSSETWIAGESPVSNEKPWIAAVEAFAIGGGCQNTLVCDRVLCEQGSYFTLPARQEGFLPGAGNLRLTRLAGPRLARQAILFGRALHAGSPETVDLCDEVVPPGEMDDAIGRAVAELTESGAVSVAAQRRAIRAGTETLDVFRQYLALYSREQALCLYSDGLIANLESYWKADRRRLVRP